MSVRQDEVQLRVVINGSAAKKELAALDQEAYQLREKMKGLKKGTEEYIAANKRLSEVETRMATLRKEIGLNGLTLKQLNAELKRLNSIKAHLTPGTKAFNDLDAEVKKVQSRITQVRTGMGPFQQAWKNLSGEVKGVAIAFAAMAGSQLISWMAGIVKGAGDLEDQLANIQKTTGMTTEQVKALNDELGRIDTRTSRKDLREMAVVAGQMGFAGEEVFGFVKAIDMASVALGDEFTGGAEEVATVLGKLRNTLQDLKSSNVEMDLLHIGNAINELGAAGMATGPVVADFANRIGGYGIQAGLTSAQVLGLSATLQELGVTTERGGTAVVKIIQKMFSNVDQFANIAGKSVDDFQQMLNNDLFGAFTLVMQKSKEMGTNSVELNKIIQDLEVAGAGASEVFAKLGSNTQMLTEKVTLAGGAISETSSITEEFNIKNATLGATLDKLKKDFASLFTSDAITNGIKGLLYGVIKVVAILKELPNFVRDNKEAFKLLGVAILAFNAQLIASRVAGLADIAVKKIQEIWILRAEYAQAMLNRTMNANPILRITALILGAVAAYKILTNKTSDARKAQEDYNAAVEAGEKLRKSTQSIADRFAVINKLSKENVQQLKNDIDNEIKAYKEKDAELIAWAEKNGILVKLNELRAKEAESVGTYQLRYKKLAEEEQEIVNAKIKMQFGYSATERNETIKRLRYQQEAVHAQLGLYEVQKAAIKELSEEEKEALAEATKRLDDLRLKINEIAHQQSLDRMSANDRELQQIRDKYAALLIEAEGHATETLRITNLMNNELLAKEQEHQDKKDALAEVEKKKKEDFIREIELLTMSGADAEVEASRAKWQALINQAEQYGLDATGLYRAMYDEIGNIQAIQANEELSLSRQKNADLIQQDRQVLEAKAGMMNDFSNLVGQALTMMGAKAGEYTSFQKGLAFTQILIDTASSISNVIAGATEAASVGGPAAPFLIAGYIASGLGTIFGAFANAKALLSSAEVPAFKDGTEYLQGPGTGTSDSILMRGSKGERIVPAHINEQLQGVPNAMLPKLLNFDFSRSLSSRGGLSGGEKEAYKADKDKVMHAKMDLFIRELQDVKKTIARKQSTLKAEVVLSGRTGLEQKQREYEEIKELAGR